MKMSKEKLIRKISDLELSTDTAIAKLSQQLHAYEEKYNLRSEIFYKLIVGTPAEDTPDFIGWGHVLQKLLSDNSVKIID